MLKCDFNKVACNFIGNGIPEKRDLGPYKNRKTGTLAGPYENRETGTLKKPGIIYNSISFKIYKVNMKCKYFQKLEI